MCGIHGLIAFRDSARPDAGLHERMGALTRHRGPDDHGYLLDGETLIGMRRLSIIDVEGGHQPLANEDESVWVVCNGEIYNFRELRAELERSGHRFRSGSDCEVIVHLYEEYGDDFVARLDGMFAFAVWDKRRRRLLLGRDRLGIKPLYYLSDGTRLAFSSEAKGLLAVPGFSAAVNEGALHEFLALGYIAAPQTLFAGVRKLPPASLMICAQGEIEIRRYWRLPEADGGAMSQREWVAELRAQIERSVRAQMVSDVPLGAFLSGGIDSSAVVAMMAEHSSQPVRTYSIGFEERGAGAFYNELPFARQVAQQYGTQHREIVVQPDVASLLPRLIWHMDEPLADSANVTTFLVSEFARRDVTVILSGVGGDELFGGYRRYLGAYYDRYYRRLPRWLRSGVLTPLARQLPSDRHSPLLNFSRQARSYLLADALSPEERYRAYVQVFDESAAERLLGSERPAADALTRAFADAADADDLRRLMDVDLATQMPDDLLMLTDRMSMATSLECRVPLLDTPLVELAARMPSSLKIRGRRLKHVLKEAVAGDLPADLIDRRKRGFGAPFGAWLKDELAPMLEIVLSPEAVRKRGLFSWPEIERTVGLHAAGRADHTDHLLALMNFELWCRMFLDGQAPADVSGELREAVGA